MAERPDPFAQGPGDDASGADLPDPDSLGAGETRSAELNYFGPAPRDPMDIDDGEGIRSGRALGSSLASLAATCVAIAVALTEPSPGVRRIVLLGVCSAGGFGAVGGLWALRGRLSHVDRSLVAAGIALGAMSIGATVLLF